MFFWMYFYYVKLGEHSKHCVGHNCYAHTFLIAGILCFGTFLLTCYLNRILPPTCSSHKHVLFPKKPHHKPLLLCHFLQPLHHHHRRSKSPYIIQQQEARRGSIVEKKELDEPDRSFLPAPWYSKRTKNEAILLQGYILIVYTKINIFPTVSQKYYGANS